MKTPHLRALAARCTCAFSVLPSVLPFAALSLSLALPSSLLAQANAGLTGTVIDNTGAVVPNAQVTVTNEGTDIAQQLVTSSAGTYAVRGLNPGSYKVEVVAPGFHKQVKVNIPVQVSQVGTIDFQLQTGTANETVEVDADQIALNTTQPQIGSTIDPATLQALPVEVSGRGRQIDSLQFLAPGTTGSTFSHRVSGGVDFEQEILYNGIPTPQPETQGYTTNFNPPYELIQEVAVQRTTFSAQYGLGQGALTYQTKSGTNRYHGDLFEINRNSSFDSVGFFNSVAQGGTGRPPTDHENNYGFTISGPLSIPHLYNARNRTFGIYSQEWFKQNVANTTPATVPTALQKTGNFSDFVDSTGKVIPIYDPLTGLPFAGNVIPASRISSVSASLLQYLPNPDRPGSGAGGLDSNKTYAPNAFPNIQHVWGFAIDHKLTSRQDIHYSQWRNTYDSTSFDYAPFVLAPNPLNSMKQDPVIGSVFLLSYSNAVTDKLVTTAGLGWVGEINNESNLTKGYSSPVVAAGVIPPNINFDGQHPLTSWGTSGAWLQSVNRKLGISAVNNWLWTHGRNTFNFGGEFRRSFQDDNEEQTAGGQFNFSQRTTSIHNSEDPNFGSYGSSFASFLLGIPDSANRSNSQELKLRNTDFSPYIQDDIKINPNLTINLGLRWDIMVPFNEVNNNVVYFNPNVADASAINLAGQPIAGGASIFGQNGVNRADIHWKHVGPRVGFAYKLNDKTVIQGGFSIAYLDGGAYEYGTNKVAVSYGNLLTGSFSRNSTGSYTSAYGSWNSTPLPNPAATPFSSGIGNGNTIHAFDPNVDGYAPYSQQWSVNVQRQLPFKTFLTAAWVGNRVIHLPSQNNRIDQLNPAYLSMGAKLNDTFAAGQTQVDGVALPYANFVNDFGGSATVAQALQPYPQYSYIDNNFEGFGTTYYQSLQVEVDKHLSNGLSFLVGYTLSHSMDNTSSGFSSFTSGGINKYNQRPEWAVSNSDEPQTLKVSGTYELPIGPGKPLLNNHGLTGQLAGGWGLGWILDYEAGTAFGVTENGVPFPNGFDRPNRVSSVALTTANYNVERDYFLGKRATAQIFNPAGFALTSSQYVLGDALRNYGELRNPAYYNEAASIQKKFFFGERFTGILKLDYFNLLNRTYFNGPDTNASDSTFGQVTSQPSNTNRQGQITARVEF